MVLLTSSAVSIILSFAIISAFTFLLFLCGYVLQQQTVRSLQEAIRRPPELRPIPSLQPAIEKADEEPETGFSEQIQQIIQSQEASAAEQIQMVADAASSLRHEEADAVDIQDGKAANGPSSLGGATMRNDTPAQSAAYLLTLPNPSDLCSAALFAKAQLQASSSTKPPSFIVLYPSSWESSPSALHIAALTFMRELQDRYDVIYHPVDTSSVWAGFGINAQLLGEVQRTRWNYDRVLYVKSPGMVSDSAALDNAVRKSNVKTSWAKLSTSTDTDPEMLLYTRMKGLMTPRKEMLRLSNKYRGEAPALNEVAYVVFDERDLVEWDDGGDDGIWRMFKEQLAAVCHNKGLLPGEQDKGELK